MIAWGILLSALAVVVKPLFRDVHLAGFHDWDTAAAFRYITVLSVGKYRQFPFWHPYLCGGFAAWGYADGAPNVISPFAPFYAFMPMFLAIRAEIVGSALVSLLGSYMLAGRFAKSPALCAFVAGVYTFNGRWALQVAAGHDWYLAYAWVPWVLYCFERSRDPGSRYAVFGGGAIFALIVYVGGIYPLPHAALFLGLYALLCSIAERRLLPLFRLVVMGVCGVGLAAPKLLVVVDVMRRFARRIESTETISIEAALAMLVGRPQTFHLGVVAVPAYGWHEWGCYIGAYSVLMFVATFYLARGRREWPLKWVGLIFWVLSLGAFSEFAPWPLLHKLPVFASHHVPSRFMALALLGSLLSVVAYLERFLHSRPKLRVMAEPVWVVCMGLGLFDIASVSRDCMVDAFTLQMPHVAPEAAFRQLNTLPYDYTPAGAWAGPSYPAMLANHGFVGCYSVPERGNRKGAIASDAQGYRGEAYVANDVGTAKVIFWSPNEVVVEYTDVGDSASIVYNMNFDPNWNADGFPALEFRHAVAARPKGRHGRVTFRYHPRSFYPGIAIAALTIAGVAAYLQRTRRRNLGDQRAMTTRMRLRSE